MNMTGKLSRKVVDSLRDQQISEARKSILDSVVEYLLNNQQAAKESRLVFICTHNSRRSQIAQFWTQLLADFYQIPISAHSGGTEVTKVAPQVVHALEKTGFEFEVDQSGESNPKYKLLANSNLDITLYSKLFTAITKSQTAFASLMCCAQAEETCPFVPGTELRVALNYEDPKHADGTAHEEEAYQNCLMLIGAEINYILSEVKKKSN